MIRADVRAALWRAREAIAAGGLGLFGLWLMALGGYVLLPLGGMLAVLAVLWAVQALRRMRFVQDVDAPGVVEVDEGQVGYLGPSFGGYVALPDLVELRLIVIHGKRLWRLRQEDGQALLIPVSATGAERLFDAFATLPGLDSQALVAALAEGAGARVVWRRGTDTVALRRIGK